MKHDVLYCKRVGVINMYRLLRALLHGSSLRLAFFVITTWRRRR